MSNWDQLYDLEPLLRTPPTEPTSKQHSYITCKPYKRYDSDVSSISSAEGVDGFDNPTWWDNLDHEEEAITRYKKFLREQLVKGRKLEKREEPEVVMTRVEVNSKPASITKTLSLPERCNEKSDHTHIVEKMQNSRDLTGPVEFCFWSMNGQECQCGKC
ncbi:unnamed protein product [Aureobasidium uvarum]|uniref:Uncharacterized protein n=1 Tax=Aureobasidium uvarum TaxID=2773716 RepID=A0A9N8PNN4_9PEZI|nr:unnamed protein product [Aureobasidium uvarum]